jgi:hypothetical protein
MSSDPYSFEFNDHLLPGERVLWTGRPNASRLVGRGDILLIPFSLMWGAFAIFWEAGVLGLFSKPGSSAPDFFVLWGIPFVIAGQYFIWGRFIYKRWDRLRTRYAITNQRIVIWRGTGEQALFIGQLPSISQTVHRDGSGTLEFGTSPFGSGFWGDSGMDFMRGGRPLAPAFNDIPDVRNAYSIIAKARADSGGT